MESYIPNNGKSHESAFTLIRNFNKFGKADTQCGGLLYTSISVWTNNGSICAAIAYLCFNAQEFEENLKRALKMNWHHLRIETSRVY